MTRYRKKPLEVDAVEVSAIHDEEVIFGDNLTDRDGWLLEAMDKGVGEAGGLWVLNSGLRVGTLEGTMRADAGDFIVRGVQGEIYAVKGSIFRQTYEAVDP